MDQVPSSTVLALCRKYGPQLITVAGLDSARVMAAIAANESSIGANCKPRYEASYDIGGTNYRAEQIGLVKRFQHAACCSYGPWQMLPCNAQQFTPSQLYADPELCAQAFVAFFNRYIVRTRQARTLEQIAQVYNSGSIHLNPPAGVLRYMDEARANYDKIVVPNPALPQETTSHA